MNPAGTVPVLFDNSSSAVVIDGSVIIEYIEEKHRNSKSFLGDNYVKRAEIRRLQNWFDEKFYHEVSKHVLNERYFDRYLPESSAPNSETLRIARRNLNIHLSYIEYLLETRKYLGGDQVSVADFAAAAQISVLDYFGDVNWQHYLPAKDWYTLIKSYRIFSEILKDRIPGIEPSEHYAQLDF